MTILKRKSRKEITENLEEKMKMKLMGTQWRMLRKICILWGLNGGC